MPDLKRQRNQDRYVEPQNEFNGINPMRALGWMGASQALGLNSEGGGGKTVEEQLLDEEEKKRRAARATMFDPMLPAGASASLGLIK